MRLSAPFPRTACPLCGGRQTAEVDINMLVCEGCRELLYPHELVHRATRRTRLAYNKANNHTARYGLHGVGN